MSRHGDVTTRRTTIGSDRRAIPETTRSPSSEPGLPPAPAPAVDGSAIDVPRRPVRRRVGPIAVALAMAAAGLVAAVAAPRLLAPASASVVIVVGVLLASGGGILLARVVGHDGRRREALRVREQALADDRAALVQLVSHELRTPLTVIRGGVETFRRADHDDLDPTYRRLLDATWRATLRLESMVHVVLSAAEASGRDREDGRTRDDEAALQRLVQTRLEEPPSVTDAAAHVEVAVAALVEQVARSLRADLPERLEVRVAPDCRLVTVEPYLWVALRCLLDNAAKFSPPGSPIEIHGDRRGDGLELRLVDHGPGLPAHYHRLAFEPFTQADASLRRTHEGIGMGLYTARRLVRRLGGEVALSAGEDGGLVATIHLPDDPDPERVLDVTRIEVPAEG